MVKFTLTSIILFLFSGLSFPTTAQSGEIVDTIIVFNPETYEETMTIVKSNPARAADGEECYIFKLGSVPFDKAAMKSNTQTMAESMVIENIKKGIEVTAKSGCAGVESIVSYTLDVKQSNGQTVSYTSDQVQDYLAATPAMFDRIVMNAISITYSNVKIRTANSKVVDLASYVIEVRH